MSFREKKYVNNLMQIVGYNYNNEITVKPVI